MSSISSIDRDNSPQERSTCRVQCGTLAVVIGVIVLIGSLVATGCLYQQLGFYSFAIGGAGVAALILGLVLKRYCLPKEITSGNTEPLISQPRAEVVTVVIAAPTVDPTTIPLPDDEPISEREEAEPVAEPAKPSLPFLFNVDLDDAHPLQSPIGIGPFIKRGPDVMTMLLAMSVVGDASPDEIFGSGITYDEIVDIPLEHWIKEDFDSYTRIKNDPKRQSLKKIIDERIEALDAAIQFKERLVRLNYPRITVKELFPAWNSSPLPYRLMLDDEIAALNVASLDNINQKNRALHAFLKERAQKREKVSPPDSAEEVKNIPLIDLPNITATAINAFPFQFPPLTFFVMAESELAQIDISKLSTPQLEVLLSERRLLQPFKPEQINANASRIKDKKLLANLSESQILGFDDSQLDAALFNILYSTQDYSNSNAPNSFLKKIFSGFMTINRGSQINTGNESGKLMFSLSI